MDCLSVFAVDLEVLMPQSQQLVSWDESDCQREEIKVETCVKGPQYFEYVVMDPIFNF